MPSQSAAQHVFQAGHASSILVTRSTSSATHRPAAVLIELHPHSMPPSDPLQGEGGLMAVERRPLKRAGSGWARPQSAVVTVRSMATLLHLDSSADLTGS